jgi:hypothetical protein
VNLFRFRYVPCDAGDFVSFWRRFYDEGKYPDEDYQRNLNARGRLEKKNVLALFEWKNGAPLSKKKRQIAERAIEKLTEINKFRTLESLGENDVREFWQIAGQITKGLIWRIFCLHIARPNDFPIFDQHVLRAYRFLQHGKVMAKKEEGASVADYDEYRSFFFQLVKQSGKQRGEVDQALMAFGQHLTPYAKDDSRLDVTGLAEVLMRA